MPRGGGAGLRVGGGGSDDSGGGSGSDCTSGVDSSSDLIVGD